MDQNPPQACGRSPIGPVRTHKEKRHLSG